MLAVLFGGSGFLGYTAWSAVDAPTKPFAIFLFAMVVHLVALVLIMLLMTFVWMLVHRDRTYWHRRTLELTDQAVIESTALTRYEVQWPAVHKVHRTSWCLYVKPTAQTAHCVPRRAFADREAFARFSALAVELKARTKPSVKDDDRVESLPSGGMITHTGGCHCGRVRFEVMAPARIDVTDCDCSICSRSGYLHLIVPKSRFKLVSGADALTTYEFNTKTAKHLFCSACGIKAFYVPRSHPDGYSVNARCLDEGTVEEMTIARSDGKNWEKTYGSRRDKPFE